MLSDIEYELRKDISAKSNIAKSSHAKKAGGGRTQCSLAQDAMTNAQLAERNGEMATYNLSQPMNLKQFRLMPRDLQKEYLEKLRSKYNASPARIAKMLGVDVKTFNLYCHGTILDDPLKHRRMSEEQNAAWDNFINPKANDEVEPANDAIEPEPDSEHINRLTFYTEEQKAEAQKEEVPVLRAHDVEPIVPEQYDAEPFDSATKYAAIPRLDFRLVGTPGEMLLALQGLLNALPWNETYEADIAMTATMGDLL